MALSLKKSDSIGILSSALCLIHCLATPLLFVAQTQLINCCDTKPFWWSSIDIVFLFISVFAIYKTTHTTTRKWVKTALWTSWFILSVIIINEKLGWFAIPETAIYVPALALIFFHFYNSKYCQCKTDNCCVNEHKTKE